MQLKLTHDDLTDLSVSLGYKSGKGICFAFSFLLAHAVFAKKLHQFFKRLELIESYKFDFNQLRRDIEQVKEYAKEGNTLTVKQEELLEILIFFEIIDLYMQPEIYLKFLGYVRQHDLETTYFFAKPKELENSDLIVLLNNTLCVH